jgi:hypothetical protein
MSAVRLDHSVIAVSDRDVVGAEVLEHTLELISYGEE